MRSSSLSFLLALLLPLAAPAAETETAPTGVPPAAAASTITRGPYLQCATPQGVSIVWRLRVEGSPSIRFGTRANQLDQTFPASQIITRWTEDDQPSNATTPPLDAAPSGTRQMEATLTGLAPDTLYHYAIYHGTERLTPETPGYTFRTLPLPGTARDGLFWIVGDSGTGNSVQLKVHTAMRDWLKKENRTLDGYLHVGDMAYGSGLDSEFQGYFFESYQDTLSNTICWPAMGNHEGRHSDGKTGIGPYYDAYLTPTNAQSGGLPSGTEAYYSFDFGRIHFICLNSHDLPRDPAGTMAQWLKADLEKTKADWLIAFWHHPPYTKGSHDSDKEQQLIEMRSLIMPIMESGGVDLVLTGHSHIYERSMLMDGAYATPTIAENVILNDGDGSPSGAGAYQKSEGLNPNEGAIQIVAGHGGTTLSRKDDPSPIMRSTILKFGSVLLDLKGDTLTSFMLSSDGQIHDTFQLVKKGRITVSRIAKPWQPGRLAGPKIVRPKGLDHGGDKAALPVTLTKTAVPLIPPGSDWNYLAGTKPNYGWQEPAFHAPGWLLGKAGFGYNDNDDATLIPSMRNQFRYLCIRREFDLTGHENPEKFRLNISYDDGFIAYLNGVEVLRVNAESGSLDTIKGVSPHEAKGKFEVFALTIPPGILKAGKNALALEGYNDDLDSSDFTLHPALYLEK